ncbi:hypothetical protein [Lysinibacter cavernae]|uniref:Alpha-tubulin suppressor-like RCC1 family protein n=1 Tax=Lysinibacter cavernae TaxID=1640652 RepID=A0A7X5QZX3_9MICO|nr:hypothetical protein [Lysinibacter cavernae]NIH52880.1 alpha-tubulin suppressor-like RCC1 family protein [Lysinibacter cavernae]
MTCTTPATDYGVTEEGNVYYGQGNTHVPVSQTGLLAGKKIDQLACNNTLMAGLDSLGDVYIWEIIPISITKLSLPLAVGEKAISITSTFASFSILTSAGRVFSTGQNNYGQFGNGSVDTTQSTRATDRIPNELKFPAALTGTKLKSIAGGASGVVGITTDGKAIQWGLSDLGTATPLPRQIYGAITDRTLVSAGAAQNSYLALDSKGMLYSWGSGLGLGLNSTGTTVYEPTLVNPFGSIDKRPVAKLFSQWAGPVFALLQDGTLHTWGASGAMGIDSLIVTRSPIPAATDMSGALQGKTILNVFPGSYTSSAQIAEDEALYWWGFGWFINEPNVGRPTYSIGSQQLIPQ